MRTPLRYLAPLAIVGLLVGCSSDGGGIEARSIEQYTIADFLDNTSLRGASFAPDRTKLLVSSNETGIFNAYAIPIDGSEPVQLTKSLTESIFIESYFPEDERFIYEADQGGNELTHVFVRELDGSITDVTPGEGLKASFLGWADDDQSFFVGLNERDNRFFDIFEVTVDGYERTRIYQDDTGYDFADISPDKRYLAFQHSTTRTNTDIHLYDRERGAMTHLTPHEGEVQNEPERFSPDGSSLYYVTDEDSEFQYLVRYELATGERAVVEQPDWDVLSARFSKNGKYLVVRINQDAQTVVKVYEAATMTPVELPEMPVGNITSVGFSNDETLMSFYMSGSRFPRDLFIYNMAGGTPRQLTHTLNENVDPYDLVDGEVVRFASYDGMEIPGVLYKPHQATAESKAPALVWVHGGPGGQSRVGYSGLIQYLVNHGYVVYAINNRGSGGYGKTFFKADNHKHGEADLKDCVSSKGMLIGTGYVDADRIGIVGGSYGGYMVLAALTFAPEEFEVGVDIFGISNWLRTFQNIPPWWEAQRKSLEDEMGPFDDEEFWRAKSPLFHAEKIVRPLMVLQGANDPRVLKQESDDIVEAARANGVPVEYILFDDEGHGFRKKENQLRGYGAILEFLDRYLKGEAEVAT